MSQTRTVLDVINTQPTTDGADVKINRIRGFDDSRLSPFLMIDELKADCPDGYAGGFPPHPHRGIETLTYLMQGHFEHRDQMGNVEQLHSGGAQWMAAGRGVIHSEMPIMEDGKLHGFQIWINQLAENKMKPAQYHHAKPEDITVLDNEEYGIIRVLAGNADIGQYHLQGPVQETGVALTVIDWQAKREQRLPLSTPLGYQSLVYVYQGEIHISERVVAEGELAILSQGETLDLFSQHLAGALIMMGTPINEPVVHHGPFVMNTFQEIEQAIEDYNQGQFEHY